MQALHSTRRRALIRSTFSLTTTLALAGCFADGTEQLAGDAERQEKEQAELGSSKLAFETGCPDDAPLCSCALKGQTVCQDPDRDGILSLYDNCDYVSNPNQANCDGDYSGDACDSNNVRITRTTQAYESFPIETGRTTCLYDEYVHSVHFDQIEWRSGTQTIERRQYCGPSGNQTVTQVVDEDLETHRCWQADYYGCNFIGADPPNPICGLTFSASNAATELESSQTADSSARTQEILPPAGACRSDADCRTFSDYCTGCDCRALGRRDPDPVCKSEPVQCLVDPCANQQAVCTAGRCSLRSSVPDAR